MVAQNTWPNLMYGARAHEFYCTPLLCTIIGSTTNSAKCGKTPVNGVKAHGNGMKSPGNTGFTLLVHPYKKYNIANE